MTQLTSTNPRNQVSRVSELDARHLALRSAASARLRALAEFELPDDVTLSQMLEHCREKRIPAALQLDAVLDANYAKGAHAVTDADRAARVEALVAWELAENECDLFLDRWLEDSVPDEAGIGTGAWLYVFGELRRWRDERPTMFEVSFEEWRWRVFYDVRDSKKIGRRFDEQDRQQSRTAS
jgi:hypothetical protein